MTSEATAFTPETQRSSPDYIEALNMRKIFDDKGHTATSLTAKILARKVGEVTDCTPEIHDKWWDEYKIEIKQKNSNDKVEAWVLEKQEKGTTVQYCKGRAGNASHMYTWFETKNGNPDPDWRSNLV